MPITGTDHAVILVQDIEAGIRTYADQLGLELSHRSEQLDAGIQQAFFVLEDGTFLELIAPAAKDSALQDLVTSRGEGVHVLALAVDDLDETVAEMQARGVKLIGTGTQQVFIHPKSAQGVMIQLWPRDRPHRWRDGPRGDTNVDV